MEARPRKNADFRKIMMTPLRPSSGGGGGGGGGSHASDSRKGLSLTETKDFIQQQMKKDRQQKSKMQRKGKSEEKGAAAAEGKAGKKQKKAPKYRDRAKERRLGLANPDYEDIATELHAAAATTAGLAAVPPLAQSDMSAEEARQKAIEESKYLGGDMEHTHLVKGLDFALLSKIRSQVEQREAPSNDGVKTATEGVKMATDDANKEEGDEAQPQCHSAMANNICGFVQAEQQKHKRDGNTATMVETFLKGRTTFVFHLSGNGAMSELPTVLMRSKEDCPQVPPKMRSGELPEALLEQLQNIMKYIHPSSRAHSKMRRKRKKREGEEDERNKKDNNATERMEIEKQEARQREREEEETRKETEKKASMVPILGFMKPKALDDDDDIFPDMGDYVCEPTKEQQEAAALAKVNTLPRTLHETEKNWIQQKTLFSTSKEEGYFGRSIHEEEEEEEEEEEGEEENKEEENQKETSRMEGAAIVPSHLQEQLNMKRKREDQDEKETAITTEERQERNKQKTKEIMNLIQQRTSKAGDTKDKAAMAEELLKELQEDEEEEGDEEQAAIGPSYPRMDNEESGPSMPEMYPSAEEVYGPAIPLPQQSVEEYYPSAAEAYPDTDAQYQQDDAQRMPPPSSSSTAKTTKETEKEKKASQSSSMAMTYSTSWSDQEARDRGLATVFRRDDSLFTRRKDDKTKQDKRERDPSFVSDTYSECYPGSYESTFSSSIVEEDDASDEEADFTKMDQGTRARKRVKPWHFENDEAWDRYNASLEATPKAAFQFGVKMSDGRKKGALKAEKKDKHAKLNKEVQQINKFLSAKKKPGPSGGRD
ncbi:IK cytokine [Balamuthia mandrillaris]